MSSTVRIALVAEGVTDYEVLKAAIESMLMGKSFDMKLLQPEGSVAFTGAGSAGAFGGGWKGCIQVVSAGHGAERWQRAKRSTLSRLRYTYPSP